MDLTRNYIFISDQLQKKITKTKVCFAGCGLGSVIAEVAVRTGFEQLQLIDGDRIEESNLNRQNYTMPSIGEYKVSALKDRLLAINPLLKNKIEIYPTFIKENNIKDFNFVDSAILVNTIDFDDERSSLMTSDLFIQNDKLVLAPVNLSFGTMILAMTKKIIAKNSTYWNQYQNIVDQNDNVIVGLLNLAIGYEKGKLDWFIPLLKKYQDEYGGYNPQLAIGSYVVAAKVNQMCLDYVNDKTEFNKKYNFINSIGLG